ncbi:OmpA family protein [Niveibacterium terrae]|uniref:OmpA family protein n=1 Tax=Niveibacterium terrae TaxID=3373598 RepID=UPI003A8CDF89
MDDKDNSTALALGVVAGVTALVIALVLALAIAESATPSAPGRQAVASGSDAAVTRSANPPVGVIHFAQASARLPADLAPGLLKILKAARAAPAAKLRISGFYRDKGEHTLAQQRAIAVSMALIGAGVAQDRILIEEPEAAKDDIPRQARRIEVRLD